jgi:hypothetical protein
MAKISRWVCLLVLFDMRNPMLTTYIRPTTAPLHDAATSITSGNAAPSLTNSSNEVASAAVATSVVANADGVAAFIVSGVDLTRYMKPPSNDTPFERFLKEENVLERIVSSPWSYRIQKL